MMTMLGAIGEFERTMMLERQREGIQRARHAGKYTGRAPTVQRQAEQVLALLKTGVSAGDVAKQLQIGRSSVYRVLRNAAAMSSCNASA
jgi:DNA invertase Pin-like site-specific DNA recombinase